MGGFARFGLNRFKRGKKCFILTDFTRIYKAIELTALRIFLLLILLGISTLQLGLTYVEWEKMF